MPAGFGFCDVVFGWDANDLAYDNGTYSATYFDLTGGAATEEPWGEFTQSFGTCQSETVTAAYGHIKNGAGDLFDQTLFVKRGTETHTFLFRSNVLGMVCLPSGEVVLGNLSRTPPSPPAPGRLGDDISPASYISTDWELKKIDLIL